MHSKVARIGSALSKIDDSDERDDLICDMDSKCAKCRRHWEDLCSQHGFDSSKDPFNAEFDAPPFSTSPPAQANAGGSIAGGNWLYLFTQTSI